MQLPSLESAIKQHLHGRAQPRRGQVYVGFKCSQQCGFCYYKSRCHEPMLSLTEIEQQVKLQLKYGIREFELTGGEPSEHPQLRDAIKSIKRMCPSSKVAVITNGGLWKSDVWDLLDEVLLSYHLGRADPAPDKSMLPLGSTWQKAVWTVQAAREHNVMVRTNTVLGSFNLSGLDCILDDLLQFKPAIVNFLPVNLFDEAAAMSKHIDYLALRPKLKAAFDKLERELPDALVFARYMPFCQMEGYEQHIVGHLQHIYDWFDWSRELDGAEFLKRLQAGQESQLLAELGRYGSTSLKCVMDVRKQLYSKSSKCLACKYAAICDGVEKTPGDQLLKHIKPSHGKLVKDPMMYIGDATEKLHASRYGEPHYADAC